MPPVFPGTFYFNANDFRLRLPGPGGAAAGRFCAVGGVGFPADRHRGFVAGLGGFDRDLPAVGVDPQFALLLVDGDVDGFRGHGDVERLAALLDHAFVVVIFQQAFEGGGVAVDDDFALEHLFEDPAFRPELVAHVLADGHARYGDDRGQPQQEDGQHGLAAGFARGDQAHQHVDQQDDGDERGQDAQARDPDRHRVAEDGGREETLSADDQGEHADDQGAGRHDESEDDEPGDDFQQDQHHLAEDRYDFGDDRFGLGVGFGAGRGGGRGDLADGLCGDLLAVHFEFLPRRTGRRNGEPHDEIADQEDAEQVAEHRAEPVQEGNPPEAGEQQGQKQPEAHPHWVDVEIFADSGADAAQLGVFRVAVEPAGDARRVAVQVAVDALPGDVLGRAHLPDDVQDQRFLHDAGVILRREDQFRDAGFDVGDDLRAVGRVLIGCLEAFEIGFEGLVSVGVHRERHARDAAFFNLFHGCRVVSEFRVCGCCRRSTFPAKSGSRPSSGPTSRSMRWR